tara:strand:+ start:469 stop:969 length:501 start_codon:yes stop_codon:yes gene_type:complete
MSQKNIQNSNAASYTLDNFRPACPMTSAIDFATSQPNVNFTGSHQVGISGCNIAESSTLLMPPLSRPSCKISLMERPFLTVPYLGRGMSDPELESKMMQGDDTLEKKSVSQLSEVSYENYQRVPLVPSLQATINNPSNLVEGVAEEGWIRGGVPSRELTRDKDSNQ